MPPPRTVRLRSTRQASLRFDRADRSGSTTLPLRGRLFRSTGQSAQKRNLLIFVTARLVNPGGAPKKQSLRSGPVDALFQNPTLVTPAQSEPRRR